MLSLELVLWVVSVDHYFAMTEHGRKAAAMGLATGARSVDPLIQCLVEDIKGGGPSAIRTTQQRVTIAPHHAEHVVWAYGGSLSDTCCIDVWMGGCDEAAPKRVVEDMEEISWT
jgi:hypothetical protein